MSAPEKEVWMVIAEHGSQWAVWADRFRSHSGDVVIVLQQKGEPLPELAARVRDRVERITAMGRSLQRAVIVGGNSDNPNLLAARSTLIKTLASAMAAGGGGELVLDGQPRDRLPMRALAATVGDLTRGTGVAIRHADTAPALANVA